MNNRLRFRAWDKSFRRMTYDIFFFWKENTITVYELEKDASKSYLPNSHIVLEQCTGLKDKNGTLIYEGDIVLTEEDGYGHIRWDNELAQFFVATEEYYTFDNIFPSEMEVVGNIHENPELLDEII